MYPESELLMLSGLQHLVYCPRQWALIHLEDIWAENRLTAEGRVLHERADTDEVEVRPGLRIVRGLYIQSRRLGLAGRADVVEFHAAEGPEAEAAGPFPPAAGLAAESGAREDDAARGDRAAEEDLSQLNQSDAAPLPGVAGLWRPFPVEYKRGKPKKDLSDKVQLCAQALCLEEMLGVRIGAGALFYGSQRRRLDVPFDAALRERTEALAAEMRELFEAGATPVMAYEAKRCDRCSLYGQCLPKATGKARGAAGYLARRLREAARAEEEE